jgi:hypothetical protein
MSGWLGWLEHLPYKQGAGVQILTAHHCMEPLRPIGCQAASAGLPLVATKFEKTETSLNMPAKFDNRPLEPLYFHEFIVCKRTEIVSSSEALWNP